MRPLAERIAEAIQDFNFYEYDDTGDVDATSPAAVSTWVYDLGEHIARALYLPIVVSTEEGKIDEIVHKFLLEHGTAKTLAFRRELAASLKKHLRSVLAEASSAGYIENIEVS